MRLWSGVVEPSLLHSKLKVGERSAMEALALSGSEVSQRLVNALCSRDGALREAVENGDVLVAALLNPRTCPVATHLITSCEVEVDSKVVEALTAKDPAKPRQKSLLEKLVCGGKCPELIDLLCDRSGAVKEVVESSEMLVATLTPTTAAALALLDRSVEISKDVSNHLATQVAERCSKVSFS